MNKGTSGNQMKTLVDEIANAQREYWRLEFDCEVPTELGKPCSANQIAKLEKMFGHPLPPSYKEFLALHNGWAGFDGDGKILAVEDHRSAWVKERIGLIDMLFAEDGKKSPFEKGAFPIMLGESINNYVVLMPVKPRSNGEMSFVTYDYAEKEETYKDFYTYLKDVLAISLSLVKRARKSSKHKSK